ncbi:Spc19-domain-containing protein [Desarmillaria tabescens]|uniref:DASH complex subunit SPC19 n=1 Tax=Armillaria tabescens TaxID=1929756 RepID=A0AA39T3E1_ARMTA|nr:Spc19-domain-containing protein [Desarmillaria tabescens]KAK0461636.1 Spc19-domain-containing protein [Desarmillaria tabescens]
MSRLSRANLKARESVFASGPEIYKGEIQAVCPPNLAECVAAMEDCCEEAYEAQILLRNGTHDYPRMANVLRNERVFLLIDESTVKKYKSDLIDEVEPAIHELIERAEQGLKSLQRKQAQLQTKVQVAKTATSRPASGTMAQHKLEQRRLHMLTKQREQLEEECAALEAEVKALESKSRQ